MLHSEEQGKKGEWKGGGPSSGPWGTPVMGAQSIQILLVRCTSQECSLCGVDNVRISYFCDSVCVCVCEKRPVTTMSVTSAMHHRAPSPSHRQTCTHTPPFAKSPWVSDPCYTRADMVQRNIGEQKAVIKERHTVLGRWGRSEKNGWM